MKFSFNKYFENCTFTLEVTSNIDLENYEYIIFSDKKSSDVIYNFYKNEMQQGNSITTDNLGKKYIKLTGFFDIYQKRPSWTKFKEICSMILYMFEINEKGVILLTPIHINKNNEIFKTKENKILVL